MHRKVQIFFWNGEGMEHWYSTHLEANKASLHPNTKAGFIFKAFLQTRAGRISRAQGLNLTIHSVQPDDQSQYQCFVTRFAQEKAAIGDKQHGMMVRLVVHCKLLPKAPMPSFQPSFLALPRIVKPLDKEEIFVRDNGTARVECLADGIPTPNVRWQRLLRSGELLLMEEGPSLIVEHFTREKEVIPESSFWKH